MTILGLVMLLLGGRMFLGGVMDLHRLAKGRPDTLSLDGSFDAQQEVILRAQVVLSNVLSSARPFAFSLHSAVRLLLGALYLFAVAAMFASDPRARRVSLLAGWAGIGASLGHGLFLAGVVRPLLPSLLPQLEAALAQDAVRSGRELPEAGAVAEQARLFLFEVPLVVSVIGVAFSLLLLAYFSSQRVRLFYNQARQADHG